LPLPENHEWFGVWMWNDQTNYGMKKRLTPEYGLVFIGPDGREFRMRMRKNGYDKVLYWQEWHYLTKRFSKDERLLLDRPGVRFDGFYISGDAGVDSRELHFDNLAFFNRDETQPLAMKKVPDAGIPTRPEGALPDSNPRGGVNDVSAGDDETVYSYAGTDGRLVYFWKGCPDTLEASWNGGARFRPARWSGARQNPAAAEYSAKIAGKTLVVDVKAPVGETFVSMGRPDGIKALSRSNVASFQDGYDWENSRSQVSALDDGNSKFFTLTFNDWYVSGASRMGFSPDTAAVTNRAAQYLPKTDGRRNPVFERLYITVSPELMETLPVIANPVSPWKSEVGSRAWCAYGSSADRDFDKHFWKELYDLGVRKVTINDHECCMRDDGESFTFREKAAPKKGGDRALRDYADYLIGELGFRYGPYNNFTDFAPVNANWRFDRVCRETAEPYYAYGEIKDCRGGMKPAWMRNYAPKPQYAYEACAYYAPRLKEKFGFNTAYCDVHTAVFPWEYVDYDWRCEGAGKFHTVYGAYAAIMLEQKRAWDGPVYSEGGCHFMYAGLTDGNYAQVRIDADKDPWIVDFDLKRIHPLEIDFGMGNPGMFLHPKGDHAAPEFAAIYDRFFAATLAFGHAPYLLIEAMFSKRSDHALGYPSPDVKYAPEKGLAYLLRSYYMVLPASARYALADAEKILYLGDDGVWRGVSAALLSGGRKMNRIAVRYSDGTHVVANGDTVKRLTASVFGRDLDLPPTGYTVWSDDGTLEIESSDRFGTRVDYSASPEAIFMDTRDSKKAVSFPKARGRGCAVRFRDGDAWKTCQIKGSILFENEP
ncbi:MAG: hypothetical protein PHV28_18480, partial [Kiritimatiellae bacterium]|nr:hypothetical protein [Kiritimatiellia bacterium]